MKRFVFTLEPVRRIREQEEQLVQVELATALRARVLIMARLEASRQAELDLHEYLRSPQLSAAQLQHISRYDELHRQKIVDATVELHHADEAIERIRVRLTDARARREALDKLKERQRTAHRAEQLAEEGRELDEIASMRRSLLHEQELVVS